MGSRRRHWDSLRLWNSRQERTWKSKKRTERQTNTPRPDHRQYNLGRHPEPTHVAVKTWNWIDEFCLPCLLVLMLIYGILLQYCCRYLSLLSSFYETQSIHVECKQNVVRLNSGKKTHASSICKRFLFPESNEPPKVTTPKAANSESNEGRYYRNSAVKEDVKYPIPLKRRRQRWIS